MPFKATVLNVNGLVPSAAGCLYEDMVFCVANDNKFLIARVSSTGHITINTTFGAIGDVTGTE